MTEQERLAQLRNMSEAELREEQEFLYQESLQTQLEWECQEINYQLGLVAKVLKERAL